MIRVKTLQDLFKRYRRPGDMVFAILFVAISVFLVSQLGSQTRWIERTKLFSQPAFWPTVSLVSMTCFAILHWIGSICSPRIEGRLAEIGFWLRSIEYALWFLAYVTIVPFLGYLFSTIIFAIILAIRAGYRSKRTIAAAAITGIVVVVVFKSFLQVRIPGGQIYELLPGTMRGFMLTYF